jgi:hypothetical protein
MVGDERPLLVWRLGIIELGERLGEPFDDRAREGAADAFGDPCAHLPDGVTSRSSKIRPASQQSLTLTSISAEARIHRVANDRRPRRGTPYAREVQRRQEANRLAWSTMR